jgi:uncharacterized protein (DUF983 family)
VPDFVPRGLFAQCPDCRRELRINRRFENSLIACKHCDFRFEFEPLSRLVLETSGSIHEWDLPPRPAKTKPGMSISPYIVAFYAACAHCGLDLRVGTKYVGRKVACRHCAQPLRIRPY